MSKLPKVGDKIFISMLNEVELEVPHLVTIDRFDDKDEDYAYFSPPIKLDHDGEENLINLADRSMDEWEHVSEDYEQHEEESLQHRQTLAYYDDEALSPSYSDAVKAGMTFAEYTGANITEESLDFEPKEEEVLRGITAESLNFEEAPKSDAVNHPSHYNRYSREVIESIKGLCTPEEFRGYLKGNIIKYSARYSGKDGLQDIDKLAKYTQFLKEFEIEMEINSKK